ncbi:carboxylesterase/lipase family protein [Allobranchiibius sp. GilTou73]|uniref:carboxylesterase/lipase family protein n=1 Tax=Allobranchiibius sp. GilTou73 TaxID=2904523 RepID=UPI001F425DFC|nr:carboxylesterase family protein [Allobranchiibius sp. GilTou73]UIJ35047.1 carboxylesterase family protein [Allobranchiibius sp. GilTou73]
MNTPARSVHATLAGTAAIAAAVALTAAAPGSLTPAATAATSSPACSSGTLVHTTKGAVCGTTADGVTTYEGIPYAAAPVGNLRWKAPVPHKAWTTTIRSTTPVQECPSPGFPPGSPPTTNTTEDCLNVKVQIPAGAKPGERLPVMYEIHGGGFLGEARTDDGSNLVRTGKVVYVFVNYRLGILGFLADKALGAHSGDYGIQDQQAGLRWVKQNISRFGGDPGNVTVFGESAGGASTCDQVASPIAKGLFQHAISVSGYYNYQNNIVWSKADCKSTYYTEAQAQRTGAQYAKKVGCGDVADVAACLRKVPVDKLVSAGGQFVEPTAGGTIGPIVNGTTLTMSPAKAFATGHVNKVDLITDIGRDEFNGGVYTNTPGLHPVVAETPAQYRLLVREQFGGLAATVERLYPLIRYTSPFVAYRTIMADSASVCPMLQSDAQVSRYIPTYADIDDDADNPAGEGLTEILGAQHSETNGLVHFDTSKLDPNQKALQTQLLLEWTYFAHTGNPMADYTPAWPLYRTYSKPVMELRPAGSSSVSPAASIASLHQCGFWDKVTHY